MVDGFIIKLIKFIKTNKFNLIYLNKSSKVKLSPYNKYNKATLEKFFRKSTNMQSISIVFKKFLIKNKLKFKKEFSKIFFIYSNVIIITPKK